MNMDSQCYGWEWEGGVLMGAVCIIRVCDAEQTGKCFFPFKAI